jgi:exoribonuclease R
MLRELFFNAPNMKWILFFNENCNGSVASRRVSLNETVDQFTQRLISAAVSYLSSTYHLTPVIIADPDDPLCHGAISLDPNQATITFEEFLQRMNLTNKATTVIHNYCLLSSAAATVSSSHLVRPPPSPHHLLTALQKPNGIKARLFSPHLSWKEIEEGLSSGTLSVGTLKVSSFSSLHGEVVLKHSVGSNAPVGSQWVKYDSVLVSGAENMNRSLDGDTVVIQVPSSSHSPPDPRQLLPRSSWKAIPVHQLLLAPVDAENEESEAAAASILDDENMESKFQEESSLVEQATTGSQSGSCQVVATAMIVGILKREIVEVVVTIPKPPGVAHSSDSEPSQQSQPSHEAFVLCVPLNRRLPKIRIHTRQWQSLQSQRVIVALDNWAIDSRYPNGHFKKSLGEKGDWKTELEALLIKHSIFPRPFSVAAIACLPSTPASVTSNLICAEGADLTSATRCEGGWQDSGWVLPSIEGRRDMRGQRIFSVDPPGCQDIDDAMGVEWIQPGLVEISVHIADVCAFLPQNSPLDLEAQVRSTTIYLSHKRIDMLPSLLSSDIASLHGMKDRYAVSMTFRATVTHKDGRPVTEEESKNALVLDTAEDICFDFDYKPTWAGRTAIVSPSYSASPTRSHPHLSPEISCCDDLRARRQFVSKPPTKCSK